MNQTERLLNDAADHIAATLEQPSDMRAWEQLLIYCPSAILLERAALAPEQDKMSDELGYATRLLEHFVAEHFPHNPDWKPLPDLIGVLTQLDNTMTIARDYKARIEALEAVLRKIAGHVEYSTEDHEAAARYKREEGLWTTDEYLADAALALEQDK